MKNCATGDAAGKSVGERLREERARIGLSQDDFAKIGGVNRNTQGSYEKNDRSPDATYLANMAAAGVDVLYVITGQRAIPSVDSLAPDEAQVLNSYRSMPEEDRASVRRLTAALAESSGRYDVKP